VPPALKEGALALGATRWESIRISVLPYARPGIIGASLLGLGRALGETMAVTMVIGNSPEISASLFAPGYSLPAVIANEFAEATGDVHVGALAALGLVLFGITLVLNGFARLLVEAVGRGPKGVRA
jgi:phosphate transport system permease protein